MWIYLIHAIGYCILLYLIILSFLYILLLFLSIKDIYVSFSIYDLVENSFFYRDIKMPPVTAIIATFNEEDNITDTILSIFNSVDYEKLFVIVVNDGSTDKTLEKLIETFDLYKTKEIFGTDLKVYGEVRDHYRSKSDIDILVIDKVNGGKSDALNVGVNACRTPLFITIDADTMVEPNAISTLVWHMITKKNCAAVGGGVYVLNGCKYSDGIIHDVRLSKNPICAIQACEYIRSFLFSRSGWNALGGALCYSGAFTLFDYKTVVDIGGFDYNNPASDYEIIIHIQAHLQDKNIDGSVGYTPAATAWTLVPESFLKFWNQRIIWQIGSLRSLMMHKKMLFNPKYGVAGIITYPFFLFGETGSVFVEFLSYVLVIFSWFLGILDPLLFTMIFILCWGFMAFLTFATMLMNIITFNKYRYLTDIFWIFLVTIIDMCGFRQLNVICCMVSSIKYFFYKR